MKGLYKKVIHKFSYKYYLIKGFSSIECFNSQYQYSLVIKIEFVRKNILQYLKIYR